MTKSKTMVTANQVVINAKLSLITTMSENTITTANCILRT